MSQITVPDKETKTGRVRGMRTTGMLVNSSREKCKSSLVEKRGPCQGQEIPGTWCPANRYRVPERSGANLSRLHVYV